MFGASLSERNGGVAFRSDNDEVVLGAKYVTQMIVTVNASAQRTQWPCIEAIENVEDPAATAQYKAGRLHYVVGQSRNIFLEHIERVSGSRA